MDNPEYLTEQEAADVLHVTPRWLKRNRSTSYEGPKVRVVRLSPRKLGYLRKDLEFFLEERSKGVEQLEMFAG